MLTLAYLTACTGKTKYVPVPKYQPIEISTYYHTPAATPTPVTEDGTTTVEEALAMLGAERDANCAHYKRYCGLVRQVTNGSVICPAVTDDQCPATD